LIPAFRAAVEGKTVKEMKNPKKAGFRYQTGRSLIQD
jgi:hypothetical protein